MFLSAKLGGVIARTHRTQLLSRQVRCGIRSPLPPPQLTWQSWQTRGSWQPWRPQTKSTAERSTTYGAHVGAAPTSMRGAEGGIRTHTPLRAADFESAASTIPPLRRCVPCKKKEWSGRGDSNPRPSPWQGDALPLSHFRSDGGMSLHPYSTKKQAAVNPSASLAPHRTQPRHPRTTPAVIPAPTHRHPSTLPPHGRRASDPSR